VAGMSVKKWIGTIAVLFSLVFVVLILPFLLLPVDQALFSIGASFALSAFVFFVRWCFDD